MCAVHRGRGRNSSARIMMRMGNLELKVDHEENDFTFDEIGSVLKIKELQQYESRNCSSHWNYFLRFFI